MGRVFQHREVTLKDLPFGHRRLQIRWRKRRYACPEQACRRRTFTETSAQVPPRHRLTGRLGAKLEDAASRSTPAVSDVAAEYAVSWWSVQQALVVRAAQLLPDPPPVRRLGLDETRVRAVRWLLTDIGWRRSEPWMTSFVDLDPDRPAGLVPGRSGAAVEAWLALQTQGWKAGVEVVALDPSAPFAAAIRRQLPHATIVVDHFHLVRLANQAVTEVRQRVARKQLGRGGRKRDLAWAHRQLLLRAGNQLSPAGLRRLRRVLDGDDPTGGRRPGPRTLR